MKKSIHELFCQLNFQEVCAKNTQVCVMLKRVFLQEACFLETLKVFGSIQNLHFITVQHCSTGDLGEKTKIYSINRS